MRLIVHFYSELTSNHHRVFVITSFCDHVVFDHLLLLNMLFIAFYIAAQISISDVHIHLKKHIQTIFYRTRVFIILIIYSGCCHVYFCCVKALTYMVWLKLTLFVTTASQFLSCHVYILSIIHIKIIYFQFYLSIHTLGSRGTL